MSDHLLCTVFIVTNIVYEVVPDVIVHCRLGIIEFHIRIPNQRNRDQSNGNQALDSSKLRAGDTRTAACRGQLGERLYLPLDASLIVFSVWPRTW